MKFQSKWGWHPCSYDVFKMLKMLNKGWNHYLKMNAKHDRYVAKEPQNKHKIWDDNKGPISNHYCWKVFDKKDAKYILENYRLARYPKEEDKVVNLTLSENTIETMYKNYMKWLEEYNSKLVG